VGWYSVIAPHHALLRELLIDGFVQPLDPARIPRLAEVDPRFLMPEWLEIDGQRYAVPLVWGTCPAIYNADLLPEPPASWLELDTEFYTGKIGMHDDGLSHFYVWGRAVGANDAANLTSEEFARTIDVLSRLKGERVRHFTPFIGDLTKELASGKVQISTTGWEGMLLLPEAEGVNLRIARLAPGDFSWLQTLAIAAEAPMLEAAHQFIDFMLSPEEQAGLATRTMRGIVHPAAVPLIDEPVRALTDYANLDMVFTTSPMLSFPPLAETAGGPTAYLQWVTAWDQIRSVDSMAA
ncbi:MAG: extracellular solute-binding protein, partial [Chloroflexota bacterium]|nr:extracellular solute-binding protein [Chloroflexota bacterium]